jgi:hypothetical protein
MQGPRMGQIASVRAGHEEATLRSFPHHQLASHVWPLNEERHGSGLLVGASSSTVGRIQWAAIGVETSLISHAVGCYYYATINWTKARQKSHPVTS